MARGRQTLRILALLLGTLATATEFKVKLSIEPNRPRPESKIKVKCAYTLTLAQTDYVIIEDKSGQPICTFNIQLANSTFAPAYTDQLSDPVSVEREASLSFQLPKNFNQTGFRCAVNDKNATVERTHLNFKLAESGADSAHCAGVLTLVMAALLGTLLSTCRTS